MVYDYEMEESKRISGSQMPHSTEETSNAGGGKAHNNAFPEETFTVLRDGGLNGNEIRKNSR